MSPLSRRDAIAFLGALAAGACGGTRASAGEAKTGDPAGGGDGLELDRAVDLVPAAGLSWLIEIAPRNLLARPPLRAAIEKIVPADRFDRFARRHGALDPRKADEIVLAGYAKTTLLVSRMPFDRARVDAALSANGQGAEGRAVERGVTRMWRNIPEGQEQVALLSGQAVVVERGKPGPLQAAVLFAQGRLRRSLPALKAEPLASASALVGGAPLRAFAAGPFEGEWAKGFAGLLRVTTAIAVALRPAADGPNATQTAVVMRLMLMGAWGEDAPAAADRLRAAFDVLANDPMGRLTGLDHPVDGPKSTQEADVIGLEATFDALAAARGLHTMLDATAAEIMAY